MNNGIRLKLDVTPAWWRTRTEEPEQFAGWLVKAVRVVLSVWPTAEIRCSREQLVVVVTFDREQRVGTVTADKRRLKEALDGIVESTVTDRSDTVRPTGMNGADLHLMFGSDFATQRSDG